jgi:hypothetical protein
MECDLGTDSSWVVCPDGASQRQQITVKPSSSVLLTVAGISIIVLTSAYWTGSSPSHTPVNQVRMVRLKHDHFMLNLTHNRQDHKYKQGRHTCLSNMVS